MKNRPNLELEAVAEMQVDISVQQIERSPGTPIDRKFVLDRLGDVTREEDSLTRKEETAVGRNLVTLSPDTALYLGFVVNQQSKLFVLGLELKAGAKGTRQRRPP